MDYIPEPIEIEAESKRLVSIFGDLAEKVCDEILDKAISGYDWDAEHELPLYQGVKLYIKKQQGIDRD